MKLDAADQKLARLHAAAERISANLVELEIDPSRQLLEASPLQGESALRWSSASAALAELWRRQTLLEALLQEAEKIRRSRRSDDLQGLLEGPSIELDSSEVPLAERELLGAAQLTDHCSPDQLLASMSTAFDDVKTVITGIGGAWEKLIPQLERARHLLRETSLLAEDLGEAGRGDLRSATETLNRLSAAITTDPLSVHAGEVDELLRTVEALRRDVEAVAALKRGFDERMAQARALLEQLQAIVRDGEAAHQEVLVKLTLPSVPPAPERHDELEAELSDVAELGRRGAWREARRALESWTTSTGTLLEYARQTRDANRAPIQARNQFRALLEAYQVKAKRLGVLEDPRLSEIFAQAHEVLYRAPTDLALAARLVRSYQQGVGSGHPTSEAMR
jgi:hypothetical protein